MIERRSTPRYKLSLVAEIDMGKELMEATTKDISAAGMRATTTKPIPKGTSVRIHLFLLSEGTEREMIGPLDLQGEVIWDLPLEGGGYVEGIKFTNISDSQRQWIRRFLARRGERKHCILIVEDSPTMRELIKLALRRVSVDEIVEAENGEEALALLNKHTVDLILLDMRMPVMDGFTFLERLSQLDDVQKPAILVITTEGELSSIERAKQFGIDDYLTKPVQSVRLAQKVQEILDRSLADMD